jgi:hypothetical protein
LSFEIGKGSKQIGVWQKPQEKTNLVPTFKRGQTSTMAWGSFFSNTKGRPIAIVPPKQRKAINFINNIYKPTLIPFLN